jgi:ribosomal-protein-alanine N-acetyltransferase
MRPADVPAVRRLERLCFGCDCGTAAMLRAFLSDAACLGLVALTASNRLAGFLLLHLDADAWEARITRVAVHPAWRRRGVGSRLLRWVVTRIPPGAGVRLRTGVNEGNLAAQLFLRANGFRAVAVCPAAARGGAEDLYLFHFSPEQP